MIANSTYIRPFEEIANEFNFVLDKLKIRFIYYKKIVEKGRNIPSAGNYIRYSQVSEIESIYRKLAIEINRKYAFEMISSFEARCVYYFKNILKRNSPLGTLLRNEVSPSKIRGDKHLMFQDLINVFKLYVHPNNPVTYNQFKNLLEYRNWIAHGRGWELPNHLTLDEDEFISDKYDFDSSYGIIFCLINELPNFPNSLQA